MGQFEDETGLDAVIEKMVDAGFPAPFDGGFGFDAADQGA